MLITHINAENVLGIKHAAVTLSTAVSLFAGGNGNGKSSLAEAVRMAFLGASGTRGAKLKAELPSLVHAGARRGQVTVHTSAGTAAITVHDGKLTSEIPDTRPAALAVVLDPQSFAAMTDNERRAFLFDLMGVGTNAAAVKARLLARQLAPAKVDQVATMLRSGFDAAHKFAKTQATEARGAWKAITGETYGAVKAATWTAAAPNFDPTDAEAASQALAGAEDRLSAATRHLGAVQEARKAAEQRTERIQQLRDQAAKVDRLRVKLEREEAELADWNQKLAEAMVGNGWVLKCPCCDEWLQFDNGQVSKFDTSQPANTQDPAPIRHSRDLMATAVRNSQRDLAAAQQAATEVQRLEQEVAAEAEADRPSEGDAQAEVDDARAERDRAAQVAAGFEAAERAAAQAEKLTAQAKARHTDALEWDALADALAPDGIPGELLAEAIGPFNERLATSANRAQWARIEITADMTIQAALHQRPYRLLSESEKWRADAMLAEAVSHLSGLRVLLLDRFDVLDLDGRGDLIDWLDDLAGLGELDTALLFGTLKAPPTGLPASIASHWIAGGMLADKLKAAA